MLPVGEVDRKDPRGATPELPHTPGADLIVQKGRKPLDATVGRVLTSHDGARR